MKEEQVKKLDAIHPHTMQAVNRVFGCNDSDTKFRVLGAVAQGHARLEAAVLVDGSDHSYTSCRPMGDKLPSAT